MGGKRGLLRDVLTATLFMAVSVGLSVAIGLTYWHVVFGPLPSWDQLARDSRGLVVILALGGVAASLVSAAVGGVLERSRHRGSRRAMLIASVSGPVALAIPGFALLWGTMAEAGFILLLAICALASAGFYSILLGLRYVVSKGFL